MVIKHGAEKKPEFVGCFAEKNTNLVRGFFGFPSQTCESCEQNGFRVL
jgi:hypothetical protein